MNSGLMIESYAQQVIDDNQITEFPVDLKQIAQNAGIQVEAKPEGMHGASGHLIKHEDDFYILYSQEINNTGFQRFSIAHELGHYFLPGHIDQILVDGQHVSHAGSFSQDQYEKEADLFAAAIMMPKKQFCEAIKKYDEGMLAIIALQDEFQASLTSTAIRYAKNVDYPLSIVVSSNDKVDFCFMSEQFKDLPIKTWLKKGASLPYTLTTTASQSNEDIQEDESTLEDWFDGDSRYKLKEEVLFLGSFGKFLTVLTLSDCPDEDEECEDASDFYNRY